MPVSFSCPQCRAVIRSPKPLAAGQRVKCPKCAKVFAVSGGDAPSEAVSSSPPASAPASAPAPAFASPPIRHRPASSMAMVNMSIMGLFLLVGGAAIAAAIYWGNTNKRHDVAILDSKSDSRADTTERSGSGDTTPRTTTPRGTQPEPPDKPPPPPPTDLSVNKGTGDEDPLAFVPADAGIVAGVDLGSLLKLRPELAPLAPQMLSGSGSTVLAALADPKKEIGLDFADLVDQVLVTAQVDWAKQTGAGSAPPDYRTFIIKSKVPFDQKKVAAVLSKAAPKRIKDKATYEISDVLVSTLYMPSDRIIILTTLDGEKLDAMLVSDGSKPVLPADAVALLQEGRKASVWAVVPFDSNLSKMLEGLLAPANIATAPAEVQPALKVVPQAKAAGLWLTLDQSNLKCSLALACGSDANAKIVATSLLNYWNAKLKPQYNKMIAENLKDVKLPANAQALLKNVSDTTVALPKQTLAEASVLLSVKAIDGLIKEAQGPNAGDLLASLNQIREKAFEKPFQMSPEEKQIFDAVNKEREGADLPALKANPKLFEVARAHAEQMKATNTALDEIDGMDNAKRLEKAGIAFEKTDINISQAAVPQVVALWKANVAAKARMLDEKVTDTGIGIARSAEGKLFITQIYLTPK